MRRMHGIIGVEKMPMDKIYASVKIVVARISLGSPN